MLFGCVSISLPIGQKEITKKEIVSQIKTGKSTKAEVQALLGEPLAVRFMDTDEEIWQYAYQPGGSVSFSFTLDLVSLTIRFTKDGIVKEKGYGRMLP